jgi:hypothetical protein
MIRRLRAAPVPGIRFQVSRLAVKISKCLAGIAKNKSTSYFFTDKISELSGITYDKI